MYVDENANARHLARSSFSTSTNSYFTVILKFFNQVSIQDF
jgi:hypothetical protein